jgi:hypothetical protein
MVERTVSKPQLKTKCPDASDLNVITKTYMFIRVGYLNRLLGAKLISVNILHFLTPTL